MVESLQSTKVKVDFEQIKEKAKNSLYKINNLGSNEFTLVN